MAEVATPPGGSGKISLTVKVLVGMAILDDPNAGILTDDDLDIDEEAERELAHYAKLH